MTVRTACTHDCPDACSLLVTVEGSRVRIQGDPEHPITRGFVCYRVHRHALRLRHPERLTHPLRRTRGGWQALGWEQALNLCAERLGDALRLGAPSILPVGGGGSLGLSKELLWHFFHSLGPVTTVRGGVCGEAGAAAQRADFGELAGHDYTDLRHSAAVVLWGKNPVATGVHLVPFLAEARRRGAPVWVVDPVPTESTRLADRVVRVRPGGDGCLALAVLRRLHDAGQLHGPSLARVEGLAALEQLLGRRTAAGWADEAGVALDEVEALARLYLTRPVATWVGWGLQRTSRGGFNLRCIDALGLLTGQIGICGGGVSFGCSRRRGLDLSPLAPAAGRTVAAPTLGPELSALDDPPLRFAYVAGANPVNQHPDSHALRRALERPETFVVVADAFLTDTARAADLVLPVALMLEEDDVVGSYQHHFVARAHRAVPPPDGVRGDLWIARQLHRRLGLPRDPLLDDPQAALARITAPWFSDAGAQMQWARNPAQPAIPFADRFPTPSGKARLVGAPPADTPADDDDPRDYPLTFLTLSSRRWQTSQLTAEEQQGPPECLVHPGDAGGLRDGDRARLVSPLGVLEVQLRLEPGLAEGTCVVRRGGWICRGRGVNPLIRGRPTDLGGGTAFYAQRVRLEPPCESAADAAPP
jgi:anaerobic selenocysteine-containing dehydrogenase